MLEHKKIHSLDDYFVDLNGRQSREVYFYRINGYTEKIGDFIKKYYDTARRAGVVIEGKIPNPDEKNLAYYSEIMGMDFQMSMGFLLEITKFYESPVGKKMAAAHERSAKAECGGFNL